MIISTISIPAPINVELDLVARGAEQVGGHLGLLEPGHLPVVDVPSNKCGDNTGTWTTLMVSWLLCFLHGRCHAAHIGIVMSSPVFILAAVSALFHPKVWSPAAQPPPLITSIHHQQTLSVLVDIDWYRETETMQILDIPLHSVPDDVPRAQEVAGRCPLHQARHAHLQGDLGVLVVNLGVLIDLIVHPGVSVEEGHPPTVVQTGPHQAHRHPSSLIGAFDGVVKHQSSHYTISTIGSKYPVIVSHNYLYLSARRGVWRLRPRGPDQPCPCQLLPRDIHAE